jgi:hypothetical protein
MSKKSSKDRASLCTFTFADGRRCTSLRSGTKYDLCFFHLVKLRQRQEAEQAGEDVAAPLNSDYLNACDLSSAFGNLFTAVAKGFIKPKVANTLANIGQLLLRTQPLAKEEYVFTYGDKALRDAIDSTFNPDDYEQDSDSDDASDDDDSENDDSEEPAHSEENSDHDSGDSASSDSESPAPQIPTPPTH